MADKLDSDRLGSLDQYGHRKAMIPAEVYGIWKKRRTFVQAILICIFLILPWTKINGVQTILLDIPARKFQLFGATFWAHDAPLVFFILLIACIGLAFVTAIWGRVWCGWACPQTVFIDGLFRRIEILVEGTHLKRRKLLDEPMSFSKFYKRAVKWSIFFVLCALISHSFIAYFSGSDELIKMMQKAPSENFTYFTLVFSITGLLLFNFGWFREQFCIIMCPYGRIQSVLMDSNSLAVLYDEKRGEPRKNPAIPPNKQGDCVACNKCVQVCPTGIDIRKGIQMECIACTACMDACNDIMDKVGKPRDLIRYNSESGHYGKIKTFRAWMYLGIIFIGAVALIYQLSHRNFYQAIILRGKDMPYTITQDENQQPILINHFRLHLKNQAYEDLDFQFNLNGEEAQKSNLKLVAPITAAHLKSGEDTVLHFFVESKKLLTEHTGIFKSNLNLTVTKGSEKTESKLELQLTGPK